MEKKKFILTDEYKQNVFAVPEGYFDAMQERLTERIAAESRPQPSWWQALRPQLAFAAGFVALVVTGYGGLYLLNSLRGTSTDDQYDFYTYATDMLNINENDILSVVSEEKYQASDYDTDAIISYLADANLSLSDIASLE
jgi:hypothetical protein